MRKINFLFMLLVMTLVSCVGTIEDSGTPNTEAEGGTIKPAAYVGIMGAQAVSDSRVEIYFPPAPGNQENYVYQIFKDKAEQPIEVRYSALSTNYDGLLSFTYTGLEPSTKYSFSVEFKDLVKNVTSRSTNGTINAETLSNQMCDFDGIVDARTANGLAALNTINVYWFPARDSGFVVSSEDYDPVKYEIIGISEEEGGLAKIEDLNANRIVIPIDPDKSFHAVTGLDEGTKYFFQVRCKHEGWKNKGYIDFQETVIGTYRRETNTKFIEISTKSSGSTPEFEKPFEVINPLLPSDAESQLGVQWEPASGGFAEYRLFYRKMNPGAPLSPGVYDEDSIMADASSIDDAFMDGIVSGGANPCVPRNSTCGSIKVVAEDISGNIDGLDKFAFYQVLVVACMNATCDTANRINGKATQRFGTDFALGRVIPNIVPFNGITDIENPNPAVDPTIIKLNFASPLRDSGYATRLIVRCFQGADDSSPAVFPTVTSSAVGDRDPITATGKTECDGLSLRTVLPAHAGMLGFTQIEIDGIEVNTNRNYCFSVHPEINESSGGLDYIYNDEDNVIIQCITPEVVGPNLQEFAGRRTSICEFDDSDPTNLKMKVKWFTPTGGYWTNFRVFWKEFDPDSTNPDIAGPLNFQKAIDGDADYSTADATGANDKEYTITGLSPGKKYHIGVLPYFVLGTDRYGEFNTATRECVVPYPEVEFNEWTNVLAIGPKVDGRIPETIDQTTKEWSTTRLFETLDEHGVPIEVEMDGSSLTPLDTALRGNNTIFNGVPGQENGDPNASEPPHLYSNSGIIRIEFKDILVDHKDADPSWYDNYQTFHDFREYLVTTETGTYARNQEGWNDGIDDAGDEPVNKKDRKIGYKILRSDDNKQTWVDLTRKHSTLNPFQKDDNQGLVYSELVTYFKVNGRYRTENERRVVFTDYSVKHFEDNGVTSRGRVYWYKVVPVVNGVELKYKDENSNPHHMIRVVLPPPNMSFVSRMMVNRQACIELGKEDQIRKGDGQYYSCPYNGVGARGLETPWNTSATYYDLGGDLLVDRYELGCDWSRGDMNPGSPASSVSDETATNPTLLFDIYKDFTEASGINSTPMRGCFQLGSQDQGNATDWNNDEPTNYGPDAGVTLSHKKAIPGDCFGTGERIVYPGSYDRCSNDEVNGRTPLGRSLNYPGAFRNQDDFIVNSGGDCQSPMTMEEHNAEPSLPYDNDLLYETTATGNMDPYQAHSEFGAVFYMRDEVRSQSSRSDVGTLGRYFSQNDSGNGESRFLDTNDRGRPASCFINLYGRHVDSGGGSSVEGHDTNVRPRWLSLNEILNRMRVRDVARDSDGSAIDGAVQDTIDDLYKETLGYVTNASNTSLYGGDWLPPQNIQGILDGRMHNDLPLARIMTSNASKLPQIEALNQDEYQKLCNLYEVEVGYADNTDNFVRSYPENGKPSLKKRLARRAEFVAFSAWSDRYGEATVLTLEKGDSDTTLTDILAALSNSDATETNSVIDPDSPADQAEQDLLDRLDNWEPMACNTEVKHADASHRASNFYNIDISVTTAARFKDLQPTFPLRAGTNNPHYWSGSSRLDNANYNSERCVSRYGIQDHIGNVREMGADQFWCDPDAHELTITEGANSINLADKGYMWFRESSFPTWEDQIANTGVPFGECSMRGRGNDLAAYPALNGTNMVSIYEDYTRTTYNETGLLPKVNTVDPEAVLTVRNGGDGEFLSFGATSISPSLYTNVEGENRLTLQDSAESDGGYFSPVLGLPIRCPGISCDNSADNKLITNPIFHNNLKTTDFGDVIDDDKNCEDHFAGGSTPKAGYPITNCNFPLGNSDIENFSTHEYETYRETLYTSADPGFANNSYSRGPTSDFVAGADGSGNAIMASTVGTLGIPTDTNVNGEIDQDEGDTWIDAVDPGELTGGISLELVYITPKDNGSPGVFISGGGASSVNDRPGRYALDIDMDRYHYHRKYENTARCVVKIYGADY